tara:strand:+ start:17114 stop:17608 length:495 start_codon:yes stop_codon:yes gene_type:complete
MVGDTTNSDFTALFTMYGHEDFYPNMIDDCEDGDAVVIKRSITTYCNSVDPEKDNKTSIFDESSGLICLPVLDDRDCENVPKSTSDDHKTIRKIKNRESAKKSREYARKKLVHLEKRSGDLEREVLSLKKRCKEMEDENEKLIKRMKDIHSSFLDCDIYVMDPG